MGGMQIVHLETADVPVRYKLCECPERRAPA